MDEQPTVPPSRREHHQTRLDLVWETVVFQFKLAADGMRDLILSPVSIFATLIGLITGGDEPDRYFRRVKRFGRRTDLWINLFGHQRHRDTADRFLEPLETRLKDEYERGGWVKRSADQMNSMLDSLQDRRAPTPPDAPDEPAGPGDTKDRP